MLIRVKKLHPDAKLPTQGTSGSAGWDMYAVSKEVTKDGIFIYDTGIAMEIPDGFYGECKARSSIYKTNLSLCNGTGLIDSDYRGSIKFLFYVGNPFIQFATVKNETSYKVGDRIGQILILRYNVELGFIEEGELSDTERGTGGLGSTDTNNNLSGAW